MKRGKPLKLGDVHLTILKHCLAGPASLKPLFGRPASRARVYRHAAELESAGLLRVVGHDRREATEAGRRAWEESQSFAPEENPINRWYPPLRKWSPRYQAFLRLQFLASLAREHGLRETHHPTFLLVAPTLRLKTTSGAFSAIALGEDPRRMIFLTPSESGRSPFLRKTYGGKLASVRASLKAKFVCFDEYHRATPAARQSILPYTAGSLEFPIENCVFHLRPVALIVMNPRKGATLEEMTGFRPEELRRMIPFLVAEEDVPEALRLQGDAILEAARKAGPLAMPERASVTVRAEDVAAILRPNLTPEGLALVDFELVAMLCEAMAAFAPVGHVECVIRDLLAIYESAGWAVPEWRLRLVGAVTMAPQPAAAPSAKPMTLREQTLAILARENAIVPGDLDHHVRLRRFDALLRENRLDPEVTVKKVEALVSWGKVGYPFRVFKALYPTWKETGDAARFSGAILRIVERFEPLEKFEAAKTEQDAFLAKVGGTWEDVRYAYKVKDELGAYGVSPKAGLEILRRIVAEACKRGLDPAKAVPTLFETYETHGSLAAAVEAVNAELAAAKDSLAETNAQRTAEETRLAEVQEIERREQAAHAEAVQRREAQIHDLDEGIAWRTNTLAAKDAELTAMNARLEDAKAKLARPDRIMVLGESLVQAAESGEGKALFDLARLVNEMPGHRVPVGLGLDTMKHFQRLVREFVEHIDRAADLTAKYEGAMAEKDRVIDELAHEVKRLKEPVREEGTA